MNEKYMKIYIATLETILDGIMLYLKKHQGEEMEVNSLLSFVLHLKEDCEHAANQLREKDI
jgi:hypothetical protein